MTRLPSYVQFGRRTLVKRFSVLQQSMSNLRTNADADTVHDLRVASRRFHAATVLFRECVDRRRLSDCERHVRRIRKSAGAVRDGDVQCAFIRTLAVSSGHRPARAGLERLLLRLTQRRRKKIKDIVAALDAFDKSGIENRILPSFRTGIRRRTVSPPVPLRRRAQAAIANRISQMLQYEPFVRQSTAVKELHAMRIEAKRLRYTLEIFNPVYGGRLKPFIRLVRSIQDALGYLHDCDVWQATIPAFIEKERARTAKFMGETTSFSRIERGILFLSEHAGRERTKHYLAFLKIWKSTERKQSWKTLRELPL